MKIYFIDEKSKFISLIKKIESKTNLQIILKDTKTFRASKSDVVISCGFEENDEATQSLKKYSNLVVIVDSKHENVISKLAFDYDAKDVIYSKCDEDYIAERISKYIKNFCKE